MAETGCRIDVYRPPCGGCLNPADDRRWEVSVAGNRVLLCLRCVGRFAGDLQRVVDRAMATKETRMGPRTSTDTPHEGGHDE